MPSIRKLALLLFFFSLCDYSGCSKRDPVEPDLDTEPPGIVSDLLEALVTSSTIELTWTAPGDDGWSGKAFQYDIRYSTEVISNNTFGNALQVLEVPPPGPPNSVEVFTIGGIDSSTDYYFALKTSDESGNWSGLSSVLHQHTLAEDLPPATISDLEAIPSTQARVRLSWTSPGDDGQIGTATQYDIRYSTTPFNDATIDDSELISQPPLPSPPGTEESFMVLGLNGETDYFFRIRAADEVPNWSALSNLVSVSTGENNPPSDVEDLHVANSTAYSITLAFTAPGDDGMSGTAMYYDLRYSTTPITSQTFDSAPNAENIPAPQQGGTLEEFTVSELNSGTRYYFALKTVDNAGNRSGISNPAETSTQEIWFQLTNDEAMDLEPCWSPDGTKIAFRTTRSDDDGDIWVIPSAGGIAEQLTNYPGRDWLPAWSPDGDKIAFQSTRDGDWKVFTIPADGGNASEFTTMYSKHPTWSSSDVVNNEIVFVSINALWRGLAGEQPYPVINGPGTFGSPDIAHSQIIFEYDYQGSKGLWWTYDNSDFTMFPLESTENGENPSWNPNWMDFVYSREGNILQGNGGNGGSECVICDYHNNFDAAWSPEGDRLVLVSDRGGTVDLWIYWMK